VAHLVQKPWEKVGTALVLRSSAEGTGKGIVGNTINHICGVHGTKVDHSERLVGRFNSHMFAKIFVFADEVTWGGNRKEAGVLRGLVTESVTAYEEKGLPVWDGRSFTRLLLTGNDEWIVPASADARRWQVFEVSERHRQDRVYFGRIMRDLEGGGYGHLLRFLATLDLTDYPDPTRVVQTQALVDQKLQSLGSIDRWVYTVLDNGHFSMSADWPEETTKRSVFDDYLGHAQDEGGGRRMVETAVGKRLKELFGSSLRLKRKRVGTERSTVYEWPELGEARKLFESRAVKGPVDWTTEADEGSET